MSIGKTEKNIALSTSWDVRPLGEVVQPTRPRVKPSEKPNLPFIGMENIEAHTMKLLGTVPAGTMKSSAVHFQPDDVLYGRLRPYLNKVYRPDFEGLCSAEFIVFPKTVGISSRYLQYFLNSSSFASYASHLNAGDRPRVDFEQLSPYPFPVAPYEQQCSIVAEIEKQFSRLDEAVGNLKRVKANLKRYKASVLKSAVEGKLTEDWRKQHPNVEPASSLISRTPVPPRPNRWNSRSKDIILGHPALAVGNPGLELPSAWTWSPLADIARMESGHTPSREHPEWWDGEVPWIGIADARDHDGRVIMKTFQYTNKDGLANSAARLLPSGTVCVSRTASVGYVVVLGCSMATSQDFVNWIPTAAVTSEWLRVVFSADREALRRFGKGSVHKTIYFPEWLSVHIGVPPISEQNQIVVEVERRLSVLEKLEATIEANLTRADRLRQSILSQAFSGQLVTAKNSCVS